jgi:hypothetical protein
MVFEVVIILDVESVAISNLLFQRIEVLGDLGSRVRIRRGMIVVKVV